jgi:hypothetical protein
MKKMKDLFLAIMAQLQTIESLAWIDDDYGQGDNYNQRPAIAFPAALISLSFPRIDDTADPPDLDQIVTAQSTIRLFFETAGETHSKATEEGRHDALIKYDVAAEVHAAMQGFDFDGLMNPMSRISQISESRTDGYKVIRIVYENNFLQEGDGIGGMIISHTFGVE